MVSDITVQPEQEYLKPVIKYGWLRALLFLIASFFVSMIGQVIGVIFVSIIFGVDLQEAFQNPGDLIKNIGVWGFLTITIFGFLPMLLTTWIFRKYIDKKSFKSLGFDFSNYKSDFVKGMLWGIGLMFFGFLVLLSMGNLSIESVQFIPTQIIGYLLLFSVVSLNEEIMVRGYILNNFTDSVNKYLALIITAILFGIMHGLNANISWIGLLNIILAGILLGIYYIHKQNLWFPIGIHFTWNFFQGPVFGFEVSGNATESIIKQSIAGNELMTGGEFGFEASLLATLLMIIAIVILHFQFKDTPNLL